MDKQIAIAIDTELKEEFSQKLKAQWLTVKAFFHHCIAAFIKDEITFWIKTSNNNE